MLKIKKEYVVTDDNKKKAVLLDIKTFEKIEEILESFGLGKYMEEIEDEEILSVHDAKKYYSTLKNIDMIICFYKKRFLNDLIRIPLHYRKNIERLVFEEVPNFDNRLNFNYN